MLSTPSIQISFPWFGFLDFLGDLNFIWITDKMFFFQNPIAFLDRLGVWEWWVCWLVKIIHLNLFIPRKIEIPLCLLEKTGFVHFWSVHHSFLYWIFMFQIVLFQLISQGLCLFANRLSVPPSIFLEYNSLNSKL